MQMLFELFVVGAVFAPLVVATVLVVAGLLAPVAGALLAGVRHGAATAWTVMRRAPLVVVQATGARDRRPAVEPNRQIAASAPAAGVGVPMPAARPVPARREDRADRPVLTASDA